MSIASPISSFETPPGSILRFTVEQYHQLGEMGVLTPEDRVELLEGWIVEKMNQCPAHGYVVGLLSDWFHSKKPNAFLVRCQLPITTEHSEPEPDLILIEGGHKDFRKRHPRGSECRLLVEVADSSLQKDRAKAAIYAAAGVGEYWIVNLPEKQLEVFCDSDGEKYRRAKVYQPSDSIELGLGSCSLNLKLSEIFAD